MRDSLKRSAADSPVKGFEKHAKGSVVLCNACAAPIAILDAPICLGDKAGRMASAFKPLTLAHLTELAARTDIDAGLRALVNGWDVAARRAHVAKLHEFRTGDPMLCPACDDCFVQVLSVEKNEVLDKSYTIELVTIPPVGAGKPAPIRGKKLGTSKDWIHETTVH